MQIDFNEAFKDKEQPWFGQEIFYMTGKARKEVDPKDANESATLTQTLAVQVSRVLIYQSPACFTDLLRIIIFCRRCTLRWI